MFFYLYHLVINGLWNCGLKTVDVCKGVVNFNSPYLFHIQAHSA